MRIVFFIDTMTKGGAERVIANIANYLSCDKTYEITILTLLDRKIEYELNSNVRYDSLKIKEGKKNVFQKINAFFENTRKYNKFLKINKPDLVISFLPRASYYSAICKKRKVKLIISERNDPKSIYNTKLKEIFTKLLYSRADGFVFQTKLASQFFGKNVTKNSIVIPNPVNDKFFIEPYLKEREKIIVSVGRLTNQKNHFLLIDAFNDFCKMNNDYELHIYGDGPLKGELEQKITELNLRDKVFLLGITDNIIEKIYKAKMFILSSDYEGMPNALMEALTLGVPCISTDCPCGGPSELIENKISGLLVPVKDKFKLTEAIYYFVNDKNDNREISIKASANMKKYNIEVINSMWKKYINTINNKNNSFFLKEKLIYWMGKNYIKVPNAFFLKIKYKYMIGENLNLKKPRSFNEKLQWLKLNDKKTIYTKMVDKYEVRDYISEQIGKEYLIPLIGVYDSFDDIDFNKLPSKFVIKCNHDSGGLVICKNKNELDINSVKEKITRSFNNNYYYSGREWPYKNVKPKIIIEKYMEDKSTRELIDYKVMCFNGVPKIIFTCSERYSADGLKVTFFDTNWQKMPFERHYPSSSSHISKPVMLNEMIRLSKILSSNIPFVRVDWYEINGKLYFGELTFYPGSGFEEFNPSEWDYKLGDMLDIQNIGKE